jgi:hypothetical protein
MAIDELKKAEMIDQLDVVIGSAIYRVTLPDGSSTAYRSMADMIKAQRILAGDKSGGIKIKKADFRE